MESNEHKHHYLDTERTDISPDHLAFCPVTGDVIDTAEAEKLEHFRDYNGKRIYFCCGTCVHLFDENPEKYAHKSHDARSLTLKEKEHLVDNIWAFRFVSDRPLSWIPGQFIRVEIPHDSPDSEGTKRWFTISSTPSDGFLQITTRVTGTTFKQALAAITVSEKVRLIERPDGDFIWQESENPLVFVAGGIGITPFYSMIKARIGSGQSVSATLIYNGRTDDLPFKAEFDEASKRHSEFSVRYVIGEQLNVEKLRELVPDFMMSQIYISGPEPMVEALGRALMDEGLSESDLHQDFFPHYTENTY
ncbi:MAG: YHS domain-containing protein [Candidatus Saccharibacteria bacterium]|nr:MAG: YHS domain-containing protein [Candidatus Saccharibacteria bacterium]